MTEPATATLRFRAARDFLLHHRTDHEAASAGFQKPSLQQFNWALDWFDVIARSNDRTALWIVEEDGSEQRFSFEVLSRRSNQVARWLKEQGVARGDRIVLMLGNRVELWEVLLAAMKLGAVVIPATTLLSPTDLKDRIERGGAKHVVTSPEVASKLDGATGEATRISVGDAPEGWRRYADAARSPEAFTPDGPTNGNDTLLLYFTSGTTAKPKLVEHTHLSYPVGHLSTMYWIGIQPGDVHLNISSPGWAKHAWSNVFAPWNAEATVLVYNYARFDARALLAQMVRCGVTTFCAPPTVWRMLIQSELSGSRGALREVVGAGEPLNPEVIEQVKRAWGLTIRDGYGQTETTAQIGNPPGQVVKPGSMGRPLPGYRVSLLDPLTSKPGNEGEICLDLGEPQLGLMVGYRDDEALNAEVMREGHYHTGDVASRDDEGYITYVGRSDDVFKASDYRISPFELESVLIEHPAVAEAAVVPSPDPLRLAVPKAFVTLASGYEPTAETALALFTYARDHLSPYKRIRRLAFSALPKTISGKIRRVDLRKQEAEARAEDPEARPTGEHRYDDFPELKQ
ncbi:AMP-binding protein [Chondromyces crocatus]|uniref:AMP-dependent synthetase n=1 Tax=Chondromyces crocatus TaxID=52 RepID=A0A0K1ESN9_CHOCO|nr:AMP-binding protein [Chondromyces crocatus]AKT43623.1 AMP-dependent synthetase [Chondromyces crocatus]